MKKVIIAGAASGMGREVAKLYYAKGYKLGLADRNESLLYSLSAELNHEVILQSIDVSQHIDARNILSALIEKMGGLDIFIYTAGITDKTRIWENENILYQVNAVDFAALASLVYDYFTNQKKTGHIAGVSSVLAIHGLKQAIAYCASKAFMKTYMEGLRHDAAGKIPAINISEIRPGFVKTPMTENQKNIFWSCTASHAANIIVTAIERKKKLVYTGNRWLMIGWGLKILPEIIFSIHLNAQKIKYSVVPSG